MSPDVIVFENDEWADGVAAELRRGLADMKGGGRICLPTGETVRPMYSLLPEGLFADTTIFLLDEFGGLPPGDPARCENMLRNGIPNLPPPGGAFHHPDVDASDLAAECHRFQGQLDEGHLDLAILGLGANGHVGMNEPGSEIGSRTRVVDLSPTSVANASRYGSSIRPNWGITIGLADLLEANSIWLLVTGDGKREILNMTLEGPITEDLPASLLRKHPHMRVLVDSAAAGGLSSRRD